MKAKKITIEIGFENELVFVTFKNEDVYKAIKKVEKEYKGSIIYDVKTEY
jgi:hypothetical protein